MVDRRVVVTGLGPLASIGIGKRAFADALRDGVQNLSTITSFDPTGFPYQLAAEVRGFGQENHLKRIDSATFGPASCFAAAAARLAAEDSEIDLCLLSSARAGSAMGTTSGESQVIDRLVAQWLSTGPSSLDRSMAAMTPSYRLAVAVNQELDLSGEAVTFATACSASNYAIGYAADMIRAGEADYMVAGGADAMCRVTVAGFYRLGAMAEFACSPFDENRSGIVIGEGGAAVFLETLQSASARGAHIYGEVLGYGLNCDASHMVSPDASSIAECMRSAHRNAGVRPGDIDFISAHGTGTRLNDSVESKAIFEVFGERPPPVSSVKSMIGHTMGAASCFGAIAALVGMDEGFIPPTVNFGRPGPDMAGLDVVANKARSARLNVVQNNGFAFGGNNAITVFGKVS